MPDICYVCLSDTHFGDKSSLMTNLAEDSMDTDPAHPSPVLEQLIKCLRHLILQNQNKEEKPILILNGDILELALNTDNEAIMAFKHFIRLTMLEEERLFSKIVFIPGNHDHHIWEIDRESHYLNYIREASKTDSYLNIPWHVTNIFGSKRLIQSHFFTQMFQSFGNMNDIVVNTFYPNYGIFKEEERKCIIFHHGHYTESIYQMMSNLMTLIFPERKKPEHIWDIEVENFAWIDFFWSTLGRSGGVGQDVGLIYHKMQSPKQFKKLFSNMVDSLEEKYNLPGLDILTAKGLKWVLDFMVDRTTGLERTKIDKNPSESIEEGLKTYIQEPLLDQMLIEFDQNMPANLTFVFGHTHKPYQKDMDGLKGYHQWINIYNTGGWVVDKVNREPNHGGAVILVDKNLNTTSLRMYNESNDASKYAVSVQEHRHSNEPSNPLHERIQKLVNPTVDPWSTFSSIVEKTVQTRAIYLQEKINAND